MRFELNAELDDDIGGPPMAVMPRAVWAAQLDSYASLLDSYEENCQAFQQLIAAIRNGALPDPSTSR